MTNLSYRGTSRLTIKQLQMTMILITQMVRNLSIDGVNTRRKKKTEWFNFLLFPLDFFTIVIATENDNDTAYFENSAPWHSDKIDELCTHVDDFIDCFQANNTPNTLTDIDLLQFDNIDHILYWNCTNCKRTVDYVLTIENIKTGAKTEYVTGFTELDVSELEPCEKYHATIWQSYSNGTRGSSNSILFVPKRMYDVDHLNTS